MSTQELQSQRLACFEATKKQLQQAFRRDDSIIQAKHLADDIQKATTQLTKRLRDWVSGWIPELNQEIPDHETLITLVATKNYDELLKTLKLDESIGTKLLEPIIQQIQSSAQAIQELNKQKKSLLLFIDKELTQYMPNTQAICGSSITAELLTHAGSLERLSRLPSGTIQLLGAETALFRHLKNKRNDPPKHGLLFNHQLLQKAPRNKRGRVARALADKVTIAAKIDYFKGDFLGNKLREELEKKFR